MPESSPETARAAIAPLLLDRDSLSRRLLGLMLHKLGYPPAAFATDVASALAAAAHDAVLVDLGRDTAAAIAQLAVRSPARLIAVLGAADDDEAACRAAGACAVLRKPVTLSALAAALNPPSDDDDFDAATWADLRRLYAGAGLRELVAAVAAELPIQQQCHAAAIAANDLPALARVVHTVRGSCLQFGAADLAQLAARAEQAAQHGDAETALAASAELIAGHARLVARLRREAGHD